MTICFKKYHGTGNDFIMLDNREGEYDRLTQEEIAILCDRHFGIGSDGLIKIEITTGYNFKMRYYNSDGKEATMCGNGGRCAVAFAENLGIAGKNSLFLASDGVHDGKILSTTKNDSTVKLKMTDVLLPVSYGDGFILDTGSPHLILFVEDLQNADILTEARKIRYNQDFNKDGINVNFISVFDDHIMMRTYERGVEAETLSCGTGAVAAAIATSLRYPQLGNTLKIKSLGGDLTVSFRRYDDRFVDVWLEGPVTRVFDGNIDI